MSTWPIITQEEIYDRCVHEWFTISPRPQTTPHACAWIEAESILKVREIIQKWYERLQDGSVDAYSPDPLWQQPSSKKLLTPELAEIFLQEMDADFDLELARTSNSGRPISADMSRLPATARIAFMQEIYTVPLTREEIIDEAVKRETEGQVIPPANVKKIQRVY